MSNVQSKPLVNGEVEETKRRRDSRIPINKILGAAAWVLGAVATWQGLIAFLPGAPAWLPFVVAVATQGFLTLAQRAIWRGHPSLVGIAALLIDVALNAGGIFPYALRVGETPTARMIIAVFGGARQVAPITAMIVATVLGILIAVAPEELWSRKD